MAKQSRTILDKINGDVEAAPVAVADQPAEFVTMPEVSVKEIMVPMVPCDTIRFPFHVNVQLTPAQSTALQSLAAGLDCERAVLSDGTRVTEKRHAIRWLADQLVDQLSQGNG